MAAAAHGAKPQVNSLGVSDPETVAADELAQKYVPITQLRKETDPPCDTSEEQYQPTSVGTVLGNPSVLLQHEAEGSELTTVRRAPTAAQIAGLGEGWYLNLEGHVLGDTCVYSKDFKRLIEEGK